ncbi:MAG: hypothetical protein WC479_07075 [Candidatus Izemoplasmatales bacterium]|jgi:hypothetical protein
MKNAGQDLNFQNIYKILGLSKLEYNYRFNHEAFYTWLMNGENQNDLNSQIVNIIKLLIASEPKPPEITIATAGQTVFPVTTFLLTDASKVFGTGVLISSSAYTIVNNSVVLSIPCPEGYEVSIFKF